MADPLRGIVHQAPNGTLSHLPLEEVRINAFIVDVSARITLRQSFSNPSETPTSRAKYVFPVPARAAVCAFELQFEDGRVITGVAKERTQATQVHETALREGKTTGLVEWVTDDTFTISIGSIPANQVVTTKLVFVMDLMDDELTDQVRLQLPMSIGSRYGALPDALVNATAASSRTRLRITVDIQMSGTIHNIASPTHAIAFTPYTTVAGQPSRRRQIAKFRSRTFLEHGFVLTVHANGLDAPRCFAERDPMDGTIAMQLTLVPNIKLPPIPAQEYLFVIDRSGSMSGDRIEVAKRTLEMLLHMLPSGSTTFNIFSFGSHVDSLWPTSLIYTRQTLTQATAYVKAIEANYGGTEINAALGYAFQARNQGLPTVAFVLTDGQVHSPDATVIVVKQAVAISRATAPLRVFSLGIGEQVSTAVVDGISRAGNGESLLAVKSEEIIGKCAKLLRAGRSAFVENVLVNWGIPEEVLSNRPQVSTPNNPPPPLQQTPTQIRKLYTGMRFIVFAITTLKTAPKEVVLFGQLNVNGALEPFEVIVPVSSVRPFDKKTPDVPLVHTLAARHLITQFAEESEPFPTTNVNNGTPLHEVAKASIIRLGERYQIASTFTSFVAVDQGEETAQRRDGRSRRERSRRRSTARDVEISGDSFVGSAVNFLLGSASSAFSALFSYFRSSQGSQRRPPDAQRSSGGVRGAHRASRSRSISRSPARRRSRHSSVDTFSTLSSLNSYSSEWSESPEWLPPSSEELERIRSPSPAFDFIEHQEAALPSGPTLPGSSSTQHPRPLPPDVSSLVQLQSYDGSFNLDATLGGLMGLSTQDLQKPVDVPGDGTAWATALACAFLERHLTRVGQTDLLDGLRDKIMEYVDSVSMGEDVFRGLVERAKGLVR